MTWEDRSVVSLVTDRSRGTAFFVSSNHLFTAFHVIADRQSALKGKLEKFERISISAKLGGDPANSVAAELVTDCYNPLEDWALLYVSETLEGTIPLPLGTFSQQEITALSDSKATVKFQSYGFPEAFSKQTLTGVNIVGDILRINGEYQSARAYQLHSPNANKDALAGLSGAPCVVDGAAVGILRSNVLGQDGQVLGGTLFACPVDLPSIREKCGSFLTAVDPIRSLPGLPERELPPNPFCDVERYTDAHAEVFFGRSKTIKELYSTIVSDQTANPTLVYGTSGVGKSSILEAGLVPRLRSRFSVAMDRRSITESLASTFKRLLNEAREAASEGQPICVIMDQLEEVFASSGFQSAQHAEVAALSAAVKEAREVSRFAVKIVLGFREEWLADFRSALAAGGIRSYSEQRILPMEESEIEEVVLGIISTDRLRKFYEVGVEQGLARLLAKTLVDGESASPVAPLLSVYLSRLWDDAKSKLAGQQQFDERLLRTLQNHKDLLTTYLDEQIALVAEKFDFQTRVGFVDSILFEHTTAQQTAGEIGASALSNTFASRELDLASICEALVDARLLSRRSVQTPSGSPTVRTTRLAHDALASRVRDRFFRSNLPGQRALRLLSARVIDGAVVESESALLSSNEIKVIEQGKLGMRALAPSEVSLIQLSKDRLRRKRSGVLAISSISIAIVCWLAYSLLVSARAQEESELAWRQQATFSAMRALDDARNRFAFDPTGASTLAVVDKVIRETKDRGVQLPPKLQEVAAALFESLRPWNESREETARLFSWNNRSYYLTLNGQLFSFPDRVSFLLESNDPQRFLAINPESNAIIFSSDKTRPSRFIDTSDGQEQVLDFSEGCFSKANDVVWLMGSRPVATGLLGTSGPTVMTLDLLTGGSEIVGPAFDDPNLKLPDRPSNCTGLLLQEEQLEFPSINTADFAPLTEDKKIYGPKLRPVDKNPQINKIIPEAELSRYFGDRLEEQGFSFEPMGEPGLGFTSQQIDCVDKKVLTINDWARFRDIKIIYLKEVQQKNTISSALTVYVRGEIYPFVLNRGCNVLVDPWNHQASLDAGLMVTLPGTVRDVMRLVAVSDDGLLIASQSDESHIEIYSKWHDAEAVETRSITLDYPLSSLKEQESLGDEYEVQPLMAVGSLSGLWFANNDTILVQNNVPKFTAYSMDGKLLWKIESINEKLENGRVTQGTEAFALWTKFAVALFDIKNGLPRRPLLLAIEILGIDDEDNAAIESVDPIPDGSFLVRANGKSFRILPNGKPVNDISESDVNKRTGFRVLPEYSPLRTLDETQLVPPTLTPAER